MIKIDKTHLQEFTSLSRATKTKFTLIYKNKKYYFKTCDNISKVAQTHSLVNEVLVSHIARKCGINCVEAHFATVDNGEEKYVGVLTSSFSKQNFIEFDLKKFTIPYYNHEKDEAGLVGDMDGERYWAKKIKNATYYNNVEHTLKAISFYLNENGYNKDDYKFSDVNKLKTDLTNIAVLDFFVNNQDRHCENIEILVPNKDSSAFLKVAPIFDNELCFFDDGSYDDVLYRINDESFKKKETEYASQIKKFIAQENLNECKNSLKNLNKLNLDKEIVECLSSEFECSNNMEEICKKASEFSLNLRKDSLDGRCKIYNAKQTIFNTSENSIN